MTLFNYENKQDARITFLTIYFYIVIEINKNTGKKQSSNSEFFCIQTIPFVLLNKYLFFLL